MGKPNPRREGDPGGLDGFRGVPFGLGPEEEDLPVGPEGKKSSEVLYYQHPDPRKPQATVEEKLSIATISGV